MPLDPSKFLGRRFEDKVFEYSEQKTSLYALCAGMAQDPLDRRELDFVADASPLKVLPSQATVIAWDYGFILESGIDETMILHGAQAVTVHNPLPPAGRIRSSFRIRELYDKGPGAPAVIVAETSIFDCDSGLPLTTNLWTSVARGEGGFGGKRGPSATPIERPERTPDRVIEARTWPTQPLFYRLLGDVNPLHSEPGFAAAGGFDRPILHGNSMFAVACRAVVVGACGYRPDLIRHIECRFSAPGIPGDTIATELWIEGSEVRFRCLAVERGVELIVNGRAHLG